MKKRIISIILTVLMVVTMMPIVAFADTTPDYLSFTARNGSVTIGMQLKNGQTAPSLETSEDKVNWTVFIAGTTDIKLEANDTVYFRRADTTPTTTFSNFNDGKKFLFFTMNADTGVTVEAYKAAIGWSDYSDKIIGAYFVNLNWFGCRFKIHSYLLIFSN